ncbi:MAG: hypothetical protein R3A10_20120 [Caldilineaceae bacterium]
MLWLAQRRLSEVDALHAIIGARTAADVHADRFAASSPTPATPRLHVTTEDGSAGRAGWVTATLERC